MVAEQWKQPGSSCCAPQALPLAAAWDRAPQRPGASLDHLHQSRICNSKCTFRIYICSLPFTWEHKLHPTVIPLTPLFSFHMLNPKNKQKNMFLLAEHGLKEKHWGKPTLVRQDQIWWPRRPFWSFPWKSDQQIPKMYVSWISHTSCKLIFLT